MLITEIIRFSKKNLSGSLKTPQVLELSGVGNATILQNAGVPVVLDFPQIGENLQDQPLTPMDYIANEGALTLGKKPARWNDPLFNIGMQIGSHGIKLTLTNRRNFS